MNDKPENMLRCVDVDGFKLETWDTCRIDALGKSTLGYRLTSPGGVVIFEAEDFHCSPMHAIDSDESLRHILGLLTLRPGDTDAEYFANYTPIQTAFCEEHAEGLSIWSLEPQDDDETPIPEFVDWTGA